MNLKESLLRLVGKFGGVCLCVALAESPVSGASPGTVAAWGNNEYGQAMVPAGLTTVTTIAAGRDHSMALKNDGTIAAWGYNGYGQTSVPTGLSGVIALAAGSGHSLALKSNGAVVAWGSNSYGQTNVPVSAQSGVTAIAACELHSVALRSDGSVVAWGYNAFGQTTVPVAAQSGVTAIAAGFVHTVALKSDGSVVAWGGNTYGQTTTPASAQSGVIAISAGAYHTLALKADGSVVAWGYNGEGETIVPAAAQTGVTAISAGAYHNVALKNAATVVAWGDNSFGQTTVPTGVTGVTAVAAGGNHTVVLGSFTAPSITTQPASQAVNLGLNASFAVDASGTAPLSYQWRRDGTNLTGATSAIYNLTSTQTNQAGTYTVVVSNFVGSVTSSPPAILTVVTPPQLSSQPVSLTVVVGQDANFSVVATGTAPLSYQWRKDGTNLSGAINATYNLTSVQANQAGSYAVVVTNSAGSITSTPPALLTVIMPPQINVQPVGQSFALGGEVTLNVAAAGAGLTYQWQFNGANLSGATGAMLTVTNLMATNAGSYRVVVSGTSGGSTTSQNANLLFFGDLKTYAGTILAGPVGQQLRVDYADVITAGTTNWLVLTNITLPFSPFLLIDASSPSKTQRYYRAVPLP